MIAVPTLNASIQPYQITLLTERAAQPNLTIGTKLPTKYPTYLQQQQSWPALPVSCAFKCVARYHTY